MGVIIALLVVIAVMWFFLGKQQGTTDTQVDTKKEVSKTVVDNSGDSKAEDKPAVATWDAELTLTVIGDKRCNNCQTDKILTQLKSQPSIGSANIVEKDFSDEGIEQYLKDNNVTKLPLFAFSTKNFDTSKDTNQDGKAITDFLEELPGGDFFLQVWANFNPLVERSERGFMLLDTDKVKEIRKDSFIKGSGNGKITWIEYSDLECPFCAKLHTNGTDKDLIEKYGNDLDVVFNHFPLGFHANAQVWAEILECLAVQKWSDSFYSLIAQAFIDWKSDKDYLYKEAWILWAQADKLDKCLADETFTQKVKDQMARGTELFGVTGTPGNVLINNETGEYEIISWAYPTAEFEKIIDKLLAE